jgi:cellulose synthase/poly-beta-1,6-N-acetylglucosamine synthase-like glycosyltransferase
MDMTAWLAAASGPEIISAAPGWLLAGLFAAAWIMIAYTGYATVLALIGMVAKPRRLAASPRHRFAIVIPAHDERVVVGNLVDSCLALNYPRRLYDVFVVADNCSDDTARVARAHGAQVLERTSRTLRGKGHALAYAFSRLQSTRRRYDAFVVFDADNLVHPDFLNVMNAHLAAGHHIVQGRLDVKNPNDTWVAATFGMSFWVSNRFWFLAKDRMGLSAALGGTGMCISAAAIRRVGWAPVTLTEDLEFSARALLAGMRTHWAHDAVVFDEKPLGFAQSLRQRLRWAQGQTQVILRYLPSLVWSGLHEGSLLQLEGAISLLQPFCVLLSTLLLIADPIVVRTWPVRIVALGAPAWIAVTLLNVLLPVAAVLRDHRPRTPLRYLLLYPVFLASSVPLTWGALFTARNRYWSHTVHTRAIAYAQVVGREGSA